MLQSILVGVDGSCDSLPAIELALDWAKRFDCLLVGVGVVDEPAIHGPRADSPIRPSYRAAYEQLLAENRRNVDNSLEQLAIRCAEKSVACKLLEDEGVPSERILTEMQRYDLLLLGRKTHFAHGSERHPCQTLEQVLRNTPRPVVVVPKRPAVSECAGTLVAYDGSVQSARALQAFLASGLSVLSPVQVITIDHDSKLKAARIADRAIEFLRFHGVDASPLPVRSSAAPGKLFTTRAAQEHAALIVMGAYGESRLREFFSGSPTCTALKESCVPMFLYH
jgi:nucleotide-binding universal stress UspA family protein